MLNPVGVAQAIANAAVKPRTKGGSIKVTQADKEKKDRAMAKAILDKLGMETEKYRLGYTKVCFDLQYLKCKEKPYLIIV